MLLDSIHHKQTVAEMIRLEARHLQECAATSCLHVLLRPIAGSQAQARQGEQPDCRCPVTDALGGLHASCGRSI